MIDDRNFIVCNDITSIKSIIRAVNIVHEMLNPLPGSINDIIMVKQPERHYLRNE